METTLAPAGLARSADVAALASALTGAVLLPGR